MIRPTFCDYSGGYVHVKEKITAHNAAGAGVNNTNKKVTFEN